MSIQELVALVVIAIILVRAGCRIDSKAKLKGEPLIFPLIIATIIGLTLYMVLSWSTMYLIGYGMIVAALYYFYYRYKKGR